MKYSLRDTIKLVLLLMLAVFLIDCGGGDGVANNSNDAVYNSVNSTTGTTVTSTTTVGASTDTTSSGSLAISVKGNALVDASGQTVQLRGVNAGQLVFAAIQQWSKNDPWGGLKPNWSAITGWGANAVRLGLNEASWLGYQCANDPTALSSTMINPDPGANYKATVQTAVAEANAAGLYVILDLHWSAPNYNGVPLCPLTQNTMASADHALEFWTSVATTFKSNPAVIFELFNEPFVGEWATSGGASTAARIRDGGSATNWMYNYTATDGTSKSGTYQGLAWNIAGYQTLLNAVRATGATNVALVGNDSWSQQIVDAVTYMPTDPAPAGYSGTWTKQIAAAWHPYPIYYDANGNEKTDGTGTPQVRCVNLPGCSAAAMSAAIATVKAGYPVVITEFGDHIASTSGINSPWSQILLPFADTNGISYLGWVWNPWQDTDNVLIRDAAGTPSYGYGEYVKQHYQCRAAGTASCS